MAFHGITFDLGACILTEYNEDGFLLAQPEGLGREPRMSAIEVHHPFGFASRPRDPETTADGEPIQGAACNLLIGTFGNQTHVWLAADPRYIQLFPQLKKGGSVQYCAAGSFDIHDGEDGTKTIYVEVGDSAHLVTIGKDGNGDAIVEIVHADGMAVRMLRRSLVLQNCRGDAYVEVNDAGITLAGSLKAFGGAELGGTASVALAKYAELLAWTVNVNAALNTLGIPVAPLSPTCATLLTKGA